MTHHLAKNTLEYHTGSGTKGIPSARHAMLDVRPAEQTLHPEQEALPMETTILPWHLQGIGLTVSIVNVLKYYYIKHLRHFYLPFRTKD